MIRLYRTLCALSLFAAVLLLQACGTTELTQQELALVNAQLTRNTLEIDCPTGCRVNYRDPRDQVALPQRETWAGAVRDVGVALIGQAPVLGMYGLGVRALDSLSDLGAAGFAALQGSGAVTNITNTDITTTRTDNSIGDYSGASSGNSGQQYTNTSGRINSSDDATSIPTVVNQPAPVVVTP